MGKGTIEGVILTPLKIIKGDLGSVLHAIKATDGGYSGFGEAYFSTVDHLAVKAWKKHQIMVSNLVVPVGTVKFVIYDDRPESPTFESTMEVVLSESNYQRLTIPPGLWMGFQGAGEGLNMLLNVASIPHDPDECLNEPIKSQLIPYANWS